MTDQPQEYDDIIIGAGSAGCVLANRLSARPDRRVCLVEAGGGGGGPLIRIPAGVLGMVGNRHYDYMYPGAAQPQLGGRSITVNRGRRLGGSSAINSMIYVRGTPADYDGWAAAGCTGWGWRDVLPVFMDLERNLAGQDPVLHGLDGELPVSRACDPNPASRMFVEAAVQAGLPRNPDFNGRSQLGAGIYDLTQENGARVSAWKAFVAPVADRPNLTVLTGAEVEALELAEGRVTGVRLRRGGHVTTLSCRGETVLSAGAIGTPEILLRSGIGPAAELGKAGVTPRLDLPGVGRNLQDHVDGKITLRSADTRTIGLSLARLPAFLAAPWRYMVARQGLLTTNFVEAGGFARTRFAGAEPDIQFHFIPGFRGPDGRKVAWGHGLTLHTCLLRPASTGAVRLVAGGQRPEIDQRFFTEGDDLATLADGIRLAREILAQPALAPLAAREVLPGPDLRSPEEIGDYLRRSAMTVFHPAGTARMGRDPGAVVDPDGLRVHGMRNLRVADASVMPRLVSGNTNAPTMMIGERAARAMEAARAA